MGPSFENIEGHFSCVASLQGAQFELFMQQNEVSSYSHATESSA